MFDNLSAKKSTDPKKQRMPSNSRRTAPLIVLALTILCTTGCSSFLQQRNHHHRRPPIIIAAKGSSTTNCPDDDSTLEPLSSQEEDISSCLSSLLERIGGPDHTAATADPPQVYIIGTGLSASAADLPLSTLAVLARADVVLHDDLSLPGDEIRKIVRKDCIVRSVGKRGDKPDSVKQRDIDQLLVAYATATTAEPTKKHPTIVRLKGGDPFLFGRSRTEIEALRSKSIRYRVIPNLSSAVAGPHSGGIPLTDPLLESQSFAVFSGTNAMGVDIGSSAEENGGDDKWGTMDVDALVFLMIGRVDKLDRLRKALVGSGGDRWHAGTRCAIIRNAGRPDQEVWRSTLGRIVEDLGDGVATVSPAIFVVGKVASLDLSGS